MKKPAQDILSADDFAKERTPFELDLWSKQKSDEIYHSKEGHKAFRLQQGLIKQLIEEVFPLVYYSKYKYGDSTQIYLKSIIGNQRYDAITIDKSLGFNQESYVEITQAHEGENDFWRRKQLLETGSVFTFGPVIKTGIGKNLKVNIPAVAVEVDERFNIEMGRILKAAKGKENMEYPSRTSLLISFDDTLTAFTEKGYLQKLDLFVNKHLLSLILKFSDLYLVGRAGKIIKWFQIRNVGVSPDMQLRRRLNPL